LHLQIAIGKNTLTDTLLKIVSNLDEAFYCFNLSSIPRSTKPD